MPTPGHPPRAIANPCTWLGMGGLLMLAVLTLVLATRPAQATATPTPPLTPTSRPTLAAADLLATGAMHQLSIEGHIFDMALHPQQAQTIALALGRAIVFIDPNTWAVTERWPLLTAQATTLGWSPDGHWVATGGYEQTTLTIWDRQTQQATATLTSTDASGVWSLAWSPDGQWLAASGSSESCAIEAEAAALNVWQMREGQASANYIPRRAATVGEVSWSADSTRLISHDYCSGVSWWQVGTWEQQANLDANLYAISLAPDEQRFAAAGYAALRDPSGLYLYDIATWQATPLGDEGFVSFTALAWSPDGRWLAVAGWSSDGVSALLAVIDTRDGHIAQTIVAQGYIAHVAWSPDGTWLVYAGASLITRWDIGDLSP